MAGFILKVKTQTSQQVVKDLTPQSTIGDLKSYLVALTDISVSSLHVLFGYPPKRLDLSRNERTLESCGIKSSDTLTVEEKIETPADNMNDEAPRSHITDSDECAGVLIKKIVPPDNSCLFTSVGFVLNGKVDTTIGTFMRQIIANVIEQDPENYSEAVLGKGRTEYITWIKKPESWGGAIELSILSNHYGLEIVVVDATNEIINKFGEDKQFGSRVLLFFDGVHYDPLYLEGLDGRIQTMFPRTNDRILSIARELAKEAKSSRQYTDVDKSTFKCYVCDSTFVGQTEVAKHAKSSGHANFGEVA